MRSDGLRYHDCKKLDTPKGTQGVAENVLQKEMTDSDIQRERSVEKDENKSGDNQDGPLGKKQQCKGRKTMSEPRIETEAEEVNASTKGITLRIMTWNVDGFNDPAKRLAVVSYLWEQKVDIATVTESHLLDDDIFTDPGEGEERIMKIQLDHYRVVRWRNREPTAVGGC